DTYNLGDELEGKVTKVVSFGAFVEILDGVEGLVHISELANHHVENPREVVNQGDVIRVKILEIDSERRRLSLSAKRVEDQVLPLRSVSDVPGPGTHVEGELTEDGELGEVRDLGLSEDVFAGAGDPAAAGTGTAEVEALGAATLSSDDVVRELLTGGEVRDMLVERFGDRVCSDGEIDRGAVAEVVFSDSEQREWLEGVLWPRVGERIAAWREAVGQGDPPPLAAVV